MSKFDKKLNSYVINLPGEMIDRIVDQLKPEHRFVSRLTDKRNIHSPPPYYIFIEDEDDA